VPVVKRQRPKSAGGVCENIKQFDLYNLNNNSRPLYGKEDRPFV
jgi:hypothetical protein